MRINKKIIKIIFRIIVGIILFIFVGLISLFGYLLRDMHYNEDNTRYFKDLVKECKNIDSSVKKVTVLIPRIDAAINIKVNIKNSFNDSESLEEIILLLQEKIIEKIHLESLIQRFNKLFSTTGEIRLFLYIYLDNSGIRYAKYISSYIDPNDTDSIKDIEWTKMRELYPKENETNSN